MTHIATIAAFVLASAGFVVGSQYVASNDAALDSMYDCVVETAQAQHYPEPYSQAAWELFAPSCSR